MSFNRVEDFAFHGLPYIFTPPGLPLVEKSVGVSPTTSVLVRGAAGTGKSTLALAVAHAAARASGGIVLYLVTEASLSDVAYKAELLKIPSPVVPFVADKAYESGTIAVSHLILKHPDAAEQSTEVLHRRAIETADELLQSRVPGLSVPVRAIVIDGFGLPEGGGGEGLLTRSGLIAFLQTVEDQGVSPILIEETGRESSEAFTFPVDVVLALGFAPNPDTGELIRQLVVSKSRYSDSTAGPHDAVLDEGIPAIWPQTPGLDFGPLRSPVGFFMPIPDDKGVARVVAINQGALILSLYDRSQLRVVRSLRKSPGLILLSVDCGPTITITGGGKTRSVSTSHGPAALLWALHEALRDGTANGLEIYRMEYLFERSRFSPFLPEVLDRLVRRGFMVEVHGTAAGLAKIDEIARFTGFPGHWLVGDLRTTTPRDFRIASAWTSGPLPGIERPGAVGKVRESWAELQTARMKLQAGEFAEAARIVEARIAPLSDPESVRLRVEQVLLLDRLGKTRTAAAHLKGLTSDNPKALAALGWALAEIGEHGEACRIALDGIDRDDVPTPLLLLWNALFCRFTKTRGSILNLFGGVPEASQLQIRFLAQACAFREEMAPADQLITNAGERFGLSASIPRLQADIRLESALSDNWRDAAVRYDAILREGALSSIDQADVLFNRGIIHERLGEPDSAIRCFGEACRVNPLLEPASDRLATLGVSVPA